MIRKRSQNVGHLSRPSRKGWMVGLALLVLALPRMTHAQDVAFSLTQQVVGDTLEVTLNGQSLDAQPDQLTSLIVSLDASPCLQAAQPTVNVLHPGSTGSYDQNVLSTTSGLKMALFRNNTSGGLLTLEPVPQPLLVLKLEFDAAQCPSPSVSLSTTEVPRLTNLIFKPLIVQ